MSPRINPPTEREPIWRHFSTANWEWIVALWNNHPPDCGLPHDRAEWRQAIHENNPPTEWRRAISANNPPFTRQPS